MKADLIAKGAERYVVGKVERFNQKNEMFERAIWDSSQRHIGEKWSLEEVMPRDKPGYRLQDMAFANAAWHLEDNFGGRETGRNLDGMSLYDWDWDGRFSSPNVPSGLRIKVDDPIKITREVKKVATFFGASLVGVCELDRRWVYSYAYHPDFRAETLTDFAIGARTEAINIPEDYRFAIAIAIEMDYAGINCSPACPATAAVGIGYSKMAFIAGSLAQYIRGLGYQAIPCGNDTACSIPIAIDAGLGELARNGFLITPKFGPRVRLCKVFTDLPLIPDKPIEFGVWDFCLRCEKCAKHCPSKAIMFGEPTQEIHNISNREGLLRWPVNAERCLGFWATSNSKDCASCIRSCPFNKPPGWIHSAARWGVKNMRWMDSLFVKMDDLLGYGKRVKAEQFWEE